LFDDDATEDGSFAASLREAELDLIDDYAQGRLDADERRDVERHLLQTGEDRLQLTIARALAQVRSNAPVRERHAGTSKHASASPSPRRRGTRWKYGAAGGAMAAGLALVVLVLAGIQPRKPPAPTDAVATAPAVIQSVALLASTQRGAAELEITLEHGTTALRLQAEVARPQTGTRYVLRVGDAGRTVFVADDLSLHQSGPYAYVEAVIPAALFGAGVRQVSLQAQADTEPGFVWQVHTRKAD
jgi:hypothetical protein